MLACHILLRCHHHNKYSYYLNPILLGKKNNEDDYFEDTSIAPVYNIYSGGIALGSTATVSEHTEDGIAVGVRRKNRRANRTSVGFFTQAMSEHSSAYGFKRCVWQPIYCYGRKTHLNWGSSMTVKGIFCS